jgi:YVTN family beta-propeller protein
MTLPVFPFLALSAVSFAQGQPLQSAQPPLRRLATGQYLHPAGTAIRFGGRPVDLALSPDHKTLYIKDNRGVVVADAVTWTLRQELPFPAGGGSMHGIAVSADGTRVFATNAENGLFAAWVGEDGRLTWDRTIPLPGPGGSGASDPCGIALSADGATAYVCLSRNNALAVVDLVSGTVTGQIPVGVAPWDVALAPDGRMAYVSDWGGRRPRDGERAADSSGTKTLIDARGVASSGTVSVVDLQAGRETAQIEVGLHPCALALSTDGGSLYVANANSDTVSVIDCHARQVVDTISVHANRRLPFGNMPTGLALSADGKILWVTLGGANAVAQIGLGAVKHSWLQGLIPAGWYPGAAATDGRSLFFCNVKGDGTERRPASAKGYNTYQYVGTVNRVGILSASDLHPYTVQALNDTDVNDILGARLTARSHIAPVPVPERAGEPSVFEHVIYVIKENRTYDQVLGDIGRGNSDPALCIYGEKVTPNQHALARQFVLLDNFYCNGILSADGHCWATEGSVTDHLEKSFGGFSRSYTWGDDPLTYSSTGFLWDNVLDHGLSFRNYGEMDYAEPVPKAGFKPIYEDYVAGTHRYTFHQSIGIDRLRQYTRAGYPGWNLDIPDVLRADIFIQDLAEYEKTGGLPNLTILYLGDNHTSGTRPGSPTPRAQVADNDLALGRVVEAVSKSRFWPKTCLFVVEDDPQDGFDHVDGHRSPALVISPYTRHAAVVHPFYNQTSVLHTMEQILGLSPMNQFDALAPLMKECFTSQPDLQPYRSLTNRIPLDEMNPPLHALRGRAREWARKSLAMDLRHPDEVNEETFNRILWASARGANCPYPTQNHAKPRRKPLNHGLNG